MTRTCGETALAPDFDRALPRRAPSDLLHPSGDRRPQPEHAKDRSALRQSRFGLSLHLVRFPPRGATLLVPSSHPCSHLRPGDACGPGRRGWPAHDGPLAFSWGREYIVKAEQLNNDTFKELDTEGVQNPLALPPRVRDTLRHHALSVPHVAASAPPVNFFGLKRAGHGYLTPEELGKGLHIDINQVRFSRVPPQQPPRPLVPPARGGPRCRLQSPANRRFASPVRRSRPSSSRPTATAMGRSLTTSGSRCACQRNPHCCSECDRQVKSRPLTRRARLPGCR